MSGDQAGLWTLFLADAGARVDAATRVLAGPAPDEARLAAAVGELFALRTEAQLLGVEPVGRLAAAIGRTLEGAGDHPGRPTEAWETLRGPLSAALMALGGALTQLGQPDSSGPHLDSAVLDEAVAALEGGSPPAPAVPLAAPDPSDEITWVPQVDDDMIDPFLEEATERIEALASKLLRLEEAPGDRELVRDLFRDLHTIKGSSAFVGLRRMNRLAHAAEDLVGQVRDGRRPVDRSLVDALLAALDGLRAILDRAAARLPIEVDVEPLVAGLREPRGGSLARTDPSAGAAPPAGAVPAVAAGAAPPAAARQTLRVDFDKLDVLLNLVGELVLNKASLHAGVAGFAALGRELEAQVRRARREHVRRGASRPAPEAGGGLLAAAAAPPPGGERSGSSDGGRRHAAAAPPRASDGPGGGGPGSPVVDDLDRGARVLAELAHDLGLAVGRLDHVSAELRDQVMKLRMLPIARIFNKYQRTVRELAHALGKRVRLEIHGAETELDKVLVEQLDEPLLHLIRNAVDHGCEPPDARVVAGKRPEATVTLAAHHRGSQIFVEVSDDGAGINPARLRHKALEKGLATAEELDALDDRAVLGVIFRPGFSTAARVSEVSGRGVGMDVVRETITRLKGSIDIASRPGEGTTFLLKLPLTLAIIQVLLVRVAGYDLAVPLDAVKRTLSLGPGDVHWVHQRPVILLDDAEVPILPLALALELDGEDGGLPEWGAGGGSATSSAAGDAPFPVVLVEAMGESFALACDRLLGKQEIVIKSLGELLVDVPCVAGATLLGEEVVLILDLPAVVQHGVRRYADRSSAREPSRPAAPLPGGRSDGGGHRMRILVAEDSDVVRDSLRRLLETHGYEVVGARDGAEALALAEGDPRGFDLVSTDVMMPNLDGYELSRRLRLDARHRGVPIVMVTARGEKIDRVRGFDAGVDEYIVKPLDPAEILRAIARHLPSGPR